MGWACKVKRSSAGTNWQPTRDAETLTYKNSILLQFLLGPVTRFPGATGCRKHALLGSVFCWNYRWTRTSSCGTVTRWGFHPIPLLLWGPVTPISSSKYASSCQGITTLDWKSLLSGSPIWCKGCIRTFRYDSLLKFRHESLISFGFTN